MLTIYWNPDPEMFWIPFIHFPILWYGFFFAVGFWIAFLLFSRILFCYFRFLPCTKNPCGHLKATAAQIADQLTLYIVAGTLIGARLGHFLFYEHPATYCSDFLEFFRFRHGGLASHGAVLGIVFAAFLFARRIKTKYPDLNWVRILDLIAPPAAFVGCCIRIGNFFNQEILGTESSLPWAIVFGRAIDGKNFISRHPAQLYEAASYLVIFFLLWHLKNQKRFLLVRGRLTGLFFVLVFAVRFFLEFLKTEQSHIFLGALTMGQILSIPAVFAGCVFLYLNVLKKEILSKEVS